jgi:hypothetical protein
MHTYVQTYTIRRFADPYKRCRTCGEWIEGVQEWSGSLSDTNHPCGHPLGYDDLCPSWGPVDGCTCPPGSHAVPPNGAVPSQP